MVTEVRTYDRDKALHSHEAGPFKATSVSDIRSGVTKGSSQEKN